MDALSLLRRDHLLVRDLFRQFDENTDLSTRKAIVDEAIAELMLHAQLEEEIFYPAMERAGMKDLVGHAEEEHHAADLLMQELAEMDARNSQLEAKFQVLIATVTEHMTEEESQMFPRAAELGRARLEEIGAQLEAARPRLVRPAASARQGQPTTATRTGTRSTTASRRSRTTRKNGATAARKNGATARAKTTTRSATSRTTGNRGKLDQMTRDDLYERAKRQDIQGRSQMNKKQLVRALSGAR